MGRLNGLILILLSCLFLSGCENSGHLLYSQWLDEPKKNTISMQHSGKKAHIYIYPRQKLASKKGEVSRYIVSIDGDRSSTAEYYIKNNIKTILKKDCLTITSINAEDGFYSYKVDGQNKRIMMGSFICEAS